MGDAVTSPQSTLRSPSVAGVSRTEEPYLLRAIRRQEPAAKVADDQEFMAWLRETFVRAHGLEIAATGIIRDNNGSSALPLDEVAPTKPKKPKSPPPPVTPPANGNGQGGPVPVPPPDQGNVPAPPPPPAQGNGNGNGNGSSSQTPGPVPPVTVPPVVPPPVSPPPPPVTAPPPVLPPGTVPPPVLPPVVVPPPVTTPPVSAPTPPPARPDVLVQRLTAYLEGHRVNETTVRWLTSLLKDLLVKHQHTR